MRKLLQIRPTYEQAILNEDTAGIYNSHTEGPYGNKWSSAVYALSENKIPIGLTAESIFRNDTFRKFKVRLTSKSTGRKMDFNLTFSHTHNTTEEENFLKTTLEEIKEPPAQTYTAPQFTELGSDGEPGEECP